MGRRLTVATVAGLALVLAALGGGSAQAADEPSAPVGFTATTGLVDQQTVTVTGVPPGTTASHTIAQCPPVETVWIDYGCLTLHGGMAPDDGRVDVDVQARIWDHFHNRIVDCRTAAGTCELRVIRNETIVARQPLTFVPGSRLVPLGIAVDAPSHVTPGLLISVTVDWAPRVNVSVRDIGTTEGMGFSVAQCIPGVCSYGETGLLHARIPFVVQNPFRGIDPATNAVTERSCSPPKGGCFLRVSGGNPVWTVDFPLDFSPAPAPTGPAPVAAAPGAPAPVTPTAEPVRSTDASARLRPGPVEVATSDLSTTGSDDSSWPWIAGLGVLAVLAAGGGWWWYRGRGAAPPDEPPTGDPATTPPEPRVPEPV